MLLTLLSICLVSIIFREVENFLWDSRVCRCIGCFLRAEIKFSNLQRYTTRDFLFATFNALGLFPY